MAGPSVMIGGTFAAEFAAAVAARGRLVRVVVAEADGSTPREAGAAMLVDANGFTGTIGGGALELEATHRARRLLEMPGVPWQREVWTLPLGPSLGQCCGGRVTLLAEVFGTAEASELASADGLGDRLLVRCTMPGEPPRLVRRRIDQGGWPVRVGRVVADMLSGARPPAPVLVRSGAEGQVWFIEPLNPLRWLLVLYGAGHVGRAIVRVLDGLPFVVTWADTAADRFHGAAMHGAIPLAAPDLARVAGEAPADSIHLVMTYSHAIDLAICHAVLARDRFRHLGLIGSTAKRARFRSRLAQLGIPPKTLDRLVCPIGVPGARAKSPPAIAVSVAADLMVRLPQFAAASADAARSRLA